MTAGKVHFGMAITAIRMLRRVGSGLTVELFLDSWADYDAGMCERSIPYLNARCVVLRNIWNTTRKLGSLLKYQHKVFTLIFRLLKSSSFLTPMLSLCVIPTTSWTWSRTSRMGS
jgi:alpha 1,2-mannosyltransferase